MDTQNMNVPQAPQMTVEQMANDELKALDIQAQRDAELKQMPPKIGMEQIRKATEILQKYQEGKANLENKIINDEQYWKMRQWDRNYNKGDDYKPATAWLWSCIQSRYSDAMDSYPTCNFLARQQDDKEEAKKLSAIVPVILEQNRYEETYSDIVWYMLKHGGCIQGVFWDKSKHNGLGDIEIKKIDYLNLFWEPGITNLQDSENLFCTELVSKKALEELYPQTRGKLNSETITLKKYVYDDKVDTDDKAVVVDWYYHAYKNGKKTLQYVKYVEDVLLYATENDVQEDKDTSVDPITKIPVVTNRQESIADRGLYDHGQYPFVCQSLFPIEGSLCGYGLTDIGKDCQMQIDVMNKAITENTVVNSAPRYFTREGSGINEAEFLDTNKPLVHLAGNIDDNLQPIQAQQLNGIYAQILEHKIEELKYITSNQDVGNGQAPSGVTAASAIAALQETQGKNARSSNKSFHRAYRDMVYQVVELIRQFYDLPRMFRIAPDVMDNAQEEYISYDNSGIVAQPQMVMGQNVGYRTPEFDIEVTSEKASPYKKMEQNELALAFYGQGFFNPKMTDQALACLQMMDFSHKEDVMMRIRQNGTIYEMMLQYQQIAMQATQAVAMLTGKSEDKQYADQVAQSVLQANNVAMPEKNDVDLGAIGENPNEGTHMTRARNQARESTQAE